MARSTAREGRGGGSVTDAAAQALLRVGTVGFGEKKAREGTVARADGAADACRRGRAMPGALRSDQHRPRAPERHERGCDAGGNEARRDRGDLFGKRRVGIELDTGELGELLLVGLDEVRRTGRHDGA